MQKTSIKYVTNDGKYAGVMVVLKDSDTPIIAVFNNAKNFTVGQEIGISNNLMVIQKVAPNGKVYYWFTKGVCNYKIIPPDHKAKIVYISKSGKYVGVSIIIENSDVPVIAFFPRKENQEKGQIITIGNHLKAVSKVKNDGSIFYFFEEGICNFKLAPIIINQPPDDGYQDSFDEVKEQYYNELGESVCVYCGEYGCDCQQNIDEDYERQNNWG